MNESIIRRSCTALASISLLAMLSMNVNAGQAAGDTSAGPAQHHI
jgi:hypothetical protein